jgi:hypothetical protein
MPAKIKSNYINNIAQFVGFVCSASQPIPSALYRVTKMLTRANPLIALKQISLSFKAYLNTPEFSQGIFQSKILGIA